MRRKTSFQHLRDLVVLSMFAAIMTISDQLMNSLPNVHLIAMFTILLTRFYREKALIAIYLYVVLNGIIEGFYLSTWIMYSYIWAILWLIVILLPRNISVKTQIWLFPLIGGLHGISFGVLTSFPGYFIFYPQSARSIESYFAYIASGFPFDVAHMIGNTVACTLVTPLLSLMNKLRQKELL